MGYTGKKTELGRDTLKIAVRAVQLQDCFE
jgi:hypothetical protein